MIYKKESLLIFLILLFITLTHFVLALDNYDDVLLVTNDQSSISLQIGNYFAAQRGITYWVNISADTAEIVNYDQEFIPNIRTPIETYILNNNLQNKINYIVTTKGVPLRHNKQPCEYGNASCASVDSELTLILGPYNGSIGGYRGRDNPYDNQNEAFNHTKFGIYLVTRLDGFNWNEIKAMIDNASISDDNGVFVFDGENKEEKINIKSINY